MRKQILALRIWRRPRATRRRIQENSEGDTLEKEPEDVSVRSGLQGRAAIDAIDVCGGCRS